jgi:hypothetical protein
VYNLLPLYHPSILLLSFSLHQPGAFLNNLPFFSFHRLFNISFHIFTMIHFLALAFVALPLFSANASPALDKRIQQTIMDAVAPWKEACVKFTIPFHPSPIS